MSVLLITGPPASGKNTIGELVAKRRDRSAAIDVDLVRQMLVTPQKFPWEGPEGVAQQELAVCNASAIARNFAKAGYDVVISDVVTDATLEIYRDELGDTPIRVILLLPTEDEITARLLSRPDYLSRGEIAPVYDQQAQFLAYDDRLDNTNVAPDDVVQWILDRWVTAS